MFNNGSCTEIPTNLKYHFHGAETCALMPPRHLAFRVRALGFGFAALRETKLPQRHFGDGGGSCKQRFWCPMMRRALKKPWTCLRQKSSSQLASLAALTAAGFSLSPEGETHSTQRLWSPKPQAKTPRSNSPKGSDKILPFRGFL